MPVKAGTDGGEESILTRHRRTRRPPALVALQATDADVVRLTGAQPPGR